MKAAVILCLLGLAFADEIDWSKAKFEWPDLIPEPTGELSNSRGVQTPNTDNVCQTDQAACGCCLMHQQINRLKRSFNESVTELNKALSKAMDNLNQFRSARTAFSVALTSERPDGYYGPFRDEQTIVYKHIFLNLGNHYNKDTGVFTVPRTGVYSMALTVYSDSKGPGNTLKACASLQVNGKELAKPREFYLLDQQDSSTIPIVVRLKAADLVKVVLPIGCFLHEDGSNYNTFSVFLLYYTD